MWLLLHWLPKQDSITNLEAIVDTETAENQKTTHQAAIKGEL
jgi:hypothetical protein